MITVWHGLSGTAAITPDSSDLPPRRRWLRARVTGGTNSWRDLQLRDFSALEAEEVSQIDRTSGEVAG
jgi:hypothetical protein